MATSHKIPRIFISSTSEDLKEFRKVAQEALQESDCHPVLFEYWEGADNPPLDECLGRVVKCDLMIAIVAKCHGWTPPGQKAGENKSITRLECERANDNGISIIPFVVDDECADWPVTHTEDYRLAAAAQEGKMDEIPELAQEVQRNKTALEDFKRWLCNDRRQRRLFCSPEELRHEIYKSVQRWRNEHPEFQQFRAGAGFDRCQPGRA